MSKIDILRRTLTTCIVVIALLMWTASFTLSSKTKRAMRRDISNALKTGITAAFEDEEDVNPAPISSEDMPPRQQETDVEEPPKKVKKTAPPRDVSENQFDGIKVEMLTNLASSSKNLIVTFANNEYRDFVGNWVRHLRINNVGNYLVCAMDSVLFKFLTSTIEDDPLFVPSSHVAELSGALPSKDIGWGSKKFRYLGIMKVALTRTIVQMGFNVLMLDVDAFAIRDPNPLLEQFQTHVDILTSTDALSRSDGELEPSLGAIANIGILYLRNSTSSLLADWEDKIRDDLDYWDQNCFNDLIKTGSNEEHPESLIEGVHTCYDNTLRCGYIPSQVAANGHSYFVQGVVEDAVFVHATFVFSATFGKRHRFRETLLWRDPDSYYSAARKYLTLDLHIPTIPDEVPTVSSAWETTGHLQLLFDVMNSQLSQIRSALALSLAMNRTLVVPKLTCIYDRAWYPHDGVFPGSELVLPFVCPMDHVFDLQSWDRERLSFREHSFLQNDAFEPVNVTQLSDVVPFSTEADAKSWESTFGADNRVVHFTDLTTLNITKTFFATPHRFNTFIKKTKKLTSHWCCVRPTGDAGPGHIWYDLWYDLIPHKDMHERYWNQSWTEVLGP